MMNEPLLRVNAISVTIGTRQILDHCSLTAGEGEFIGIIGPNGAGKSTFLKAVRGLIPREDGDIYLRGKSIDSMPEKEIARTIAFMQQNFQTSFGYSCRDLVLSARYPYLKWWETERQEDRAIAEKWMQYTGVLPLADSPIQSISGGEKQRVLLAKVLAQETPLLFLDEPTAVLDLLYQEQIFRLCSELAHQGKTVIMICHNLMMAAAWCSRLVLLSGHHFLADGKPKEVITEPNLKRAFHLDALVYHDTITDQLTLYTRQKKPSNHKTILLWGSSLSSVTLMRHLYLAGYEILWGPLPDTSLAREAAKDFHISSFSSQANMPDLPDVQAVLLYGNKEPASLPFSAVCYREPEYPLTLMLSLIDDNQL